MSLETAFYSTLLRVRPAQLGDVVKKVAHIRRRHVRTKTEHSFWVDPVSILGTQLMKGGTYEEQMTRLVESVLRPSDIFIDIGANEGYFSVIAASKITCGAVHAVEPQSRLQGILEANFQLNGSKVQVHRIAISDVDGEVDLYLRPSFNTGASSIYRHWRFGSRSERVPCTTLDALCRQHSIDRVRLVKIDCEGAEPLVIKGARTLLSEQRIDFIAMEYHSSICGAGRCRETHASLTAAEYILTTVNGLNIYHLPSLEAELGSLLEHASELSPL